jgi:hypothetical protein
MSVGSPQSDSVEYAALPAPAAGWEELLLRGILFGSLLVCAILAVRLVLRHRAAQHANPEALDFGFLRDWMGGLGDTVDRADAERVTSWLEQAAPISDAASASARSQLIALLQIPRYGGPAVDAAPIRSAAEDWLRFSEQIEDLA